MKAISEKVYEEMLEKISVLEKENDSLRMAIQGAFASRGLMAYHRESSGSWPRDRFEGWLDDAADVAGVEVMGASARPVEWWRALLVEAYKAREEKEC